MAEHTPQRSMNSDALPRPWFVDDVGSDDATHIFSGDPSGQYYDWQEVAMCSADHTDGVSLQTAIADAEFIVRACNAHAELTKLHAAAQALWDAEALEPCSPREEAQKETACTDAWVALIRAIEAADKARGES